MGQSTLNANKTSGSQSRNGKNCTKTEDSTLNYQNVREPKENSETETTASINSTHNIYQNQVKHAKHKSLLSLRPDYPPSTGVDNITLTLKGS